VSQRSVGAKQRCKRVAEGPTGVRHLCLGITGRQLERQLETAGPRQQREQMVEHRDAGRDVGRFTTCRDSGAHGRGA
jgi:hypothetical protein